MSDFTPTEMMTIAAARALTNDDVCFVGIGAPSAACNVARLTHAPDITLIYESGTVAHQAGCPAAVDRRRRVVRHRAVHGARCRKCSATGCRAAVLPSGFLGGAQIDKFANLNTTVVGPYEHPKVRLPGGGGAPEIASNCGQIFITMALSKRGFVETLQFHHLDGPWRGRQSSRTAGDENQRPDPASSRISAFSSRTR